jgi:anti-anti-sigma regulatory factor
MKLVFLDISLTIDTYIDSRERTIKALQQEAIQELSTPVLPFREGMLLLPIIGQIDSQRARQLTEHLLLSIRANRAKVIVIDITGVATVDSRVANHVVQTVEAARLMGAEVVISGISPEIALTMVTLGIDLGPVYTVGDPDNLLHREPLVVKTLMAYAHTNEQILLGDVRVTEFHPDRFIIQAGWAILGIALSLSDIPDARWPRVDVELGGLDCVIGSNHLSEQALITEMLMLSSWVNVSTNGRPRFAASRMCRSK